MAGPGVPHHADDAQSKRVGITISVIAVLVAVATALANAESNKMIVKEVQASNGFAWYQSKRNRAHLNELEISRIDAQLAAELPAKQREYLETTRAKLLAKNREYETENAEIRAQAERDKKTAEVASHRHHRFEYAEVLLHVAVVLCSLTLLTRSKLFFHLGIGAAAIGIGLGVFAFLSH
jgi:hypothetical protein